MEDFPGILTRSRRRSRSIDQDVAKDCVTPTKLKGPVRKLVSPQNMGSPGKALRSRSLLDTSISEDVADQIPGTPQKDVSPKRKSQASLLLKTVDSPKPRSGRRSFGKPPPDVSGLRRSRRLSTELIDLQEDPIKEEEPDVLPELEAAAVKTRRGKRLSVAPLQPTVPEEAEETTSFTPTKNKSPAMNLSPMLELKCIDKSLTKSTPTKKSKTGLNVASPKKEASPVVHEYPKRSLSKSPSLSKTPESAKKRLSLNRERCSSVNNLEKSLNSSTHSSVVEKPKIEDQKLNESVKKSPRVSIVSDLVENTSRLSKSLRVLLEKSFTEDQKFNDSVKRSLRNSNAGDQFDSSLNSAKSPSVLEKSKAEEKKLNTRNSTAGNKTDNSLDSAKSPNVLEKSISQERTLNVSVKKSLRNSTSGSHLEESLSSAKSPNALEKSKSQDRTLNDSVKKSPRISNTSNKLEISLNSAKSPNVLEKSKSQENKLNDSVKKSLRNSTTGNRTDNYLNSGSPSVLEKSKSQERKLNDSVKKSLRNSNAGNLLEESLNSAKSPNVLEKSKAEESKLSDSVKKSLRNSNASIQLENSAKSPSVFEKSKDEKKLNSSFKRSSRISNKMNISEGDTESLVITPKSGSRLSARNVSINEGTPAEKKGSPMTLKDFPKLKNDVPFTSTPVLTKKMKALLNKSIEHARDESLNKTKDDVNDEGEKKERQSSPKVGMICKTPSRKMQEEDLYMSVDEGNTTLAGAAKDSNSPSDTKTAAAQIQEVEEEEDDENEFSIRFIDSSASEAGSDYSSGDSLLGEERDIIEDNEIVEIGETLNSEISEEDDDTYEKDSFITSDDEQGLLSGTEDDEKSAKSDEGEKSAKKWSRIKEKSQDSDDESVNEVEMSMIANANQTIAEDPLNDSKKGLTSEFNEAPSKLDVSKNKSLSKLNESGDAKKVWKRIQKPVDEDKSVSKDDSVNVAALNESAKEKKAWRRIQMPVDESEAVDDVVNISSKDNSGKNLVKSASMEDEENAEDESMSSLSEGENIKKINTEFEEHLLKLQSSNVKESDSESSDNEEDAEEEVLNSKSVETKKDNSKCEELKMDNDEEDTSETDDDAEAQCIPELISVDKNNSMEERSTVSKRSSLSNSQIKKSESSTETEDEEEDSSCVKVNKTMEPKSPNVKMNVSKSEITENNSSSESEGESTQKETHETLSNVERSKAVEAKSPSVKNTPAKTVINLSFGGKSASPNKRKSIGSDESSLSAKKKISCSPKFGNEALKTPVDENFKFSLLNEDDTSCEGFIGKETGKASITSLKSPKPSDELLTQENNKLIKDQDTSHKADPAVKDVLSTNSFTASNYSENQERKSKKRSNDFESSWTSNAGDFQIGKKVKIAPSRPVTLSEEGATTCFKVVVPQKRNKNLLTTDNTLDLRIANFKNDVLYGDRVKRENSSKLAAVYKKLQAKVKFASRR